MRRIATAVVLVLCLIALVVQPARAQQTRDSRPNIVIFLADDLGWRDTGPYGNPAVHMPSIDRLARAGLVVRYAFGTSPQCSPSRISMLSGRWPHATRTEDLHTPLPAGIPLLPALLQRVGYFTGDMAKTHYGPNGERQFQWYSPETASALPAFLDSAGTRPFFLWVGFHEPHRPYPEGRPSHAPARVRLTPYLADAPGTREDLARYYDAIERMDTKIGTMMDELGRRRLLEHTLVIFLSDNGAPFPREKGTLYDSGTRTPLILDGPAVVHAGTIWDRGMVSTLDLAPTLLELAGAPVPRDMQGRSFRALLDDPGTFRGRLRDLQRAQLARLRRAPAGRAHGAVQAHPHRCLHRPAALHRGRPRRQPFVSRSSRPRAGRPSHPRAAPAVRIAPRPARAL